MLVYQTYTIYMNEKCVYETAVLLLRREGKMKYTFQQLVGLLMAPETTPPGVVFTRTEFHIISFLLKLLHCLTNDHLDLRECMDKE